MRTPPLFWITAAAALLIIAGLFAVLYRRKLRRVWVGVVIGVGMFSVDFLIGYFVLFVQSLTGAVNTAVVLSLILLATLFIFLPKRKRCEQCRAINRRDAHFCVRCGAGFPVPPVSVRAARFQLPERARRPALLASMFALGFLLVAAARLAVGSSTELSLVLTQTAAVGTPALVATPLPTPTPLAVVDIIVAVQEIPRGMIIPPNAVQLRPWPIDAAPFNATANLDDVIGRYARTDIYREQPILSNMVVDDLNSLARVGNVQPGPVPLRGILNVGEAVTGEINDINWMDDWTFAGAAGETISFTLETTGGELLPFPILWSPDDEWVEGRRYGDDQHATLTVTLPQTGIYVLSATRARANNGSTAGTYRLVAEAGYIVVTLVPAATSTPGS
jgi:Ca2+/Na+ antiporter